MSPLFTVCLQALIAVFELETGSEHSLYRISDQFPKRFAPTLGTG